MIIINPNSGKHCEKAKSTHSYWISYSDMMAALMLIFVLVLAYSLYQNFVLMEMKLAAHDTTQINSVEPPVEQKPITTETPKVEPSNAPTITAQPTPQATQPPAAKEQAITSNAKTQQEKIAALVDVQTSIISDLGDSLSEANLHTVIDKSTGDIMLESEVFFDYNSNTIKKSGQEFLLKFIPTYINVLLDPQYSDYVGEIIIEGHTDTIGAYLYNLELSQNRALAVARYCLEQTNLSKEQLEKLQTILSAKGCSYSNPIFTADGSVDQVASRRVEFKFRLKDADMLDELSTVLDTGD